MLNAESWVELFRHDDPERVESVWLTLQSMEFPARLADRAGPIDDSEDDEHDDHADGSTVDAESTRRQPTHVEVHAAHLDELREVLTEIVQEQDELDSIIAAQATSRLRVRTAIGIAMVVLMLILLFAGIAL